MRAALAPSLALGLVVLACGPTVPPASPPAGTASATPSAAPPPDGSATPASAPPAAEAPSPFFPVAVRGAELRYFALAHGGALFDGDRLSRPLLIDEKGARREPKLFEGLEHKGEGPENAFVVYGLSGDWPRAGTLSINLPGDRGGTDLDFHWNGSTWLQAKSEPLGDMPTEVANVYFQGGVLGRARWEGRSIFYLLDTTPDGELTYQRFVLGKGGGKAPVIARGSGACPTRLVGYAAFQNLSTGDLLGIGKLCTAAADYTYYPQTGPGALAVEWWPKGQRKPGVNELPGSAGKGSVVHGNLGLIEVSPADLFVQATFLGEGDAVVPYVAHWDGKAWSDVSPPAKSAISEMWLDRDKVPWILTTRELFRRRGDGWERLAPEGATGPLELRTTAPDGTLWARSGEDLWHLTAARTWEKVSLPRSPAGERAVVQSLAWMGGDMLVIGKTSAGESLLASTRKPEKVLDLGLDDGGNERRRPTRKGALGHVGPPTPGCKNLFAVLYKLSRVAPPDFDFPLTRDALKGHTEFEAVRFAETEDGGSRYLVAFVPNPRLGRQLVALLTERVKGSKPQLLCGDPPQTNRALEIDLRTGALKKK
jgi:hypothetical protein